MTMARLYH